MQSIHELFSQAISVRLARTQRSKTWLAGEVGMSLPALSARLNAKTPFNVNDLDRVALALGLSGDELLALAIEEHAMSAA